MSGRTVIHFIRHGDVDNPQNIYYGRLPGFPLSQEGRQCIAYTAKQLADYPIEHIYYSPMQRTEETAEIIANTLNVPRSVDERLIEIATFFEGKNRGDHSRVPHYPTVKSGYAETMAEIYDRMADFVREMVELYPSGEIVAVSHGGPIHILTMGIRHRPFTDIAYEDGEIPLCGADTKVISEHGVFSVVSAEI